MGNGNQYKRLILIAILILALASAGAVSLHALEEVHYLKTFFPAAFTVQEAFYAAAIELIKVAIIAIPLMLVVAVSLFFLRQRDGE